MYVPPAGGTTYTVTYDRNGGTGTVPTQAPVAAGTAITLASGASLTGPSGTPNFAGWSATKGGAAITTPTYTVNANTTFYAVWSATAVTYTVTYNLNGGTGTTPTQAAVAPGTAITLAPSTGLSGPPATPNFAGWSATQNGAAITTSTYTVNTNTTLWAVWSAQAITYTVTYNLNGGTGTTPTQAAVAPGTAITLNDGSGLTGPGTTPKFAGWSETLTGAIIETPTIPVNTNMTLWAQWKADVPEYTVTFDANGGSAVSPVKVDQGTSMGGKFPTAPTKAGSDFDGWWDDFTEYTNSTTISANVELTARWVKTHADGENYEVPMSGKTVRNASAVTGNYAEMLVLDVGKVPLSKYEGFIMKVKFLADDGVTAVTSWGNQWVNARQLDFKGEDASGTVVSATMYNFAAGNNNQTITHDDDDDDILIVKSSPFSVANGSGTIPFVIKQLAIKANGTANNDTISFVQIYSLTFIWRDAAATPVIDTPPISGSFTVGDDDSIPKLSVTASAPDGGVLTYQWYSADAATGGTATLINDATSATYTPDFDVTSAGEYWYYVTVTNTNNNAITTKSATVTSIRAKISSQAETPVDPVVDLEETHTNSTGGASAHSATPTTSFAGGKLTVTFSDYITDANSGNKRQSVFIPLSEDQKKKIADLFTANQKFKVKIDASWDSAPGFRYGLGVDSASAWNHSNLPTAFNIDPGAELEKSGAAKPEYLIIQVNASAPTTHVLTINSITFVWP